MIKGASEPASKKITPPFLLRDKFSGKKIPSEALFDELKQSGHLLSEEFKKLLYSLDLPNEVYELGSGANLTFTTNIAEDLHSLIVSANNESLSRTPSGSRAFAIGFYDSSDSTYFVFYDSKSGLLFRERTRVAASDTNFDENMQKENLLKNLSSALASASRSILVKSKEYILFWDLGETKLQHLKI